MTRKGDTVLVAALKRYGKKIEKYIQNSLDKTMKVKVLVEDARDSQGKASGAAYLEIEVDKKDGWGGENQVEIHGTIGFDKAGKKGKKEDEAYLDGVTVGDWDDGSKAIGLSGCSIGEFLVHMFTLFAIKAGNESVLLDNAAGPRGEHIYRQVGFIKSKGDRAQYGDDNEMVFPLTGKKKNKDAGQLWRERYNKFRKKLKTKIKSKENCKSFWKSVPTALEAPGPVHRLARGSKSRTRKKKTHRKKGGNGDDDKKNKTKCTSKKKSYDICMKAANEKKESNRRVISAQDKSLGEEPSKDASSLPGYQSGRGGGRKTKIRRAKRTRKRKIPTNTVENIWGKNKKLEKFWRKLASGREVILVNKNDENTNYKLPKTHPALGNKYRELEEDDNIKAIITSAQSSDIYESLYKRVKNKTPKEIINNYKKYLIKDGKTWYL